MEGLVFLSPEESKRILSVVVIGAAKEAGLGKYLLIPGVKSQFENMLGSTLDQLYGNNFMLAQVNDTRVQQGSQAFFAQNKNYPINLRG